MKKISKYLLILSSFTLIFVISACGSNDVDDVKIETPTTNMKEKVSIIVGSQTFTLSVFDNATGRAFEALLPMTISMSELNNNEKFYDLSQSLPTSASNPGTIQNGYFMLYGSKTLVLFYKTFSTSYSYTRIGSVDNPSGLQEALGSGSTTVTFQKI